jgi:hypothetical protein
MIDIHEHKNNCVVCGKELIYLTGSVQSKCFYCSQFHDTNATCVDGHFVCDTCHGFTYFLSAPFM